MHLLSNNLTYFDLKGVQHGHASMRHIVHPQMRWDSKCLNVTVLQISVINSLILSSQRASTLHDLNNYFDRVMPLVL